MVNNKLYIGATSKELHYRLTEHIGSAKRNKTREEKIGKLFRAIRKYGPDKFKIEKIAEFNIKEEMYSFEKLKIIELDTIENGYNISHGGNGGHTRTAEQLKQLSVDFKGEKNPMFGKKHSKKTLKTINKKRKLWHKTEAGIKHLQEKKEMFTTNNPGKNKSKETLEKISKNRKGKAGFCETYEITTPDNHVIIIKNLEKYCRENGLSSSNMSSIASGKWTRHRGYQCKRIKGNGMSKKK